MPAALLLVTCFSEIQFLDLSYFINFLEGKILYGVLFCFVVLPQNTHCGICIVKFYNSSIRKYVTSSKHQHTKAKFKVNNVI